MIDLNTAFHCNSTSSAPVFANREVLARLIMSSKDIFFSNSAGNCLYHVLSLLPASRRIVFLGRPHPTVIQLADILSFVHTEISWKELNSRHESSIFLLTHTCSITGEVTDFSYISATIKEMYQNAIVIVDGAQSVGNIPVSLGEQSSVVDFYFGSLQKWLGNPMPVGFCVVGEQFVECSKFRRNLFVNDLFSIFGGELPYLRDLSIDTYNIVLAETVYQSLTSVNNGKGYFDDAYFELLKKGRRQLIDLLSKLSSNLTLLLPPERSQSNIVSFTAEVEVLNLLSSKLRSNRILHTCSEFLDKAQNPVPYIRFSAPLRPLSGSELQMLDSVIGSVL